MNAHVLGITRRFSNTSMNSIAHFYREIQPAFLDQRWEQGFEIYYKVVVPEKPCFPEKTVKKIGVFIQQSVENGF